MAVIDNLVHETSTSTGTSSISLTNVNGKNNFNTAFGTGGTDLFYYYISNRAAAEWEYGTGHLSASSTLVRDTVIGGTNGASAVNFSAGTKDVTCDNPAERQVLNLGTDGLAFSLADGGADVVFGWDDSVSQYENLTGAEVAAIITATNTFQPLDADLTSIAALTTTAAGRSVLTVSDDNLDEIVAWDDSASTMKTMALADLTNETGPATGDFVLMYGAEGDLRRADFSLVAGKATTDASPPGSPTDGNLWYDLDSGGLFVYVDDGDTSQWVEVGSGGNYPASEVLLASGTMSGASSLDIVLTSYTGYRAIKFILTNLTSNTASYPMLRCRTSSNGGSSYDSGASDYAQHYAEQFGTATGLTLVSDMTFDYISVCYFPGTAGDAMNGEVILYNQTASERGAVVAEFIGDDTSALYRLSSGGIRLSNADVDAIQFFPGTGTISGKYAVYGLL
jgi:hypothetical protein